MIYTLLPPTDERVLSSIVPFDIEEFKKQEKIGVTEFCNNMFETMKNYGGIGLSANQIGLPFRMFVMGGHPLVEEGKVRQCWNPEIVETSEEMVEMKEGCLTFPFLFLPIVRPKWVKVKYENVDKETIEEYLHDMSARVFQHEYDHMEGIVFTSLVSKEKLKYYEKKRKKEIKKAKNGARNKSRN